mgnify:CR=1 FL=1
MARILAALLPVFTNLGHDMLYFQCDYLEGCAPEILQKLVETNYDQTPGYGNDVWCERARELIRAECANAEADVHLLVGGTQTNATVIRALLRNYEAVVSVQTGHITGHEGGAVEASGHKVLTLPGVDGKMSAQALSEFLCAYQGDHALDQLMQPGAVYISHPTEYGTLYTLEELEAIAAVCRSWSLPLFIDGARLGYGLAASGTDVTLADIARLSDVFYIGGTKLGCLFGEAVVARDRSVLPHFRTTMKQAGAMLAKGRLLGIQFTELLSEKRYLKLGAHAHAQAAKIAAAARQKGLTFTVPFETNMLFLTVTDEQYRRISAEAVVGLWQRVDEEHVVIRIVTSWATKDGDVEALIALL